MYTTESNIRNGLSDIPILRVGTDNPSTELRRQITVPNGYCQNDGRLSLVKHAMNNVAYAESIGESLHYTLHKSPDAYGFAPRYDTFHAVYRHEMRDEEQYMQTYSWGMPQGLAEAEMLDHDGYTVRSFQGLAPNSLTPWKWRTGSLLAGAVDLVKAAVIESDMYAKRVLHDNSRSGVRGQGLLSHFRPNFINASHELEELLFVDNVDRTVDLQRKLGIFTTIIACDRDRVCRADYMEQNLAAAGFPMGQFMRLPNAAHYSAVNRQEYTEHMFRALVFQESFADQAQSQRVPIAA